MKKSSASKQEKLPCSAIIIAHLRNNTLDAAIQSVQYFSEIIIVATTDEKAQWRQYINEQSKSNIRLFFYLEPIVSFSELRNWAATKSNQDWVFFLDSDEVLEDEAHEKLSEFFATYAQTYTSLSVTRFDVFLNQTLHHGEAKKELIRCYHAEHHTFEGNVHEIVHAQNTFSSTIEIKHFAHDSINQFLADIIKYSEMASFQETHYLVPLTLKLLLFPPLKWMYIVLIQSGWKDGMAGVMYATVMTIHSIAVRLFAYEKTITRT